MWSIFIAASENATVRSCIEQSNHGILMRSQFTVMNWIFTLLWAKLYGFVPSAALRRPCDVGSLHLGCFSFTEQRIVYTARIKENKILCFRYLAKVKESRMKKIPPTRSAFPCTHTHRHFRGKQFLFFLFRSSLCISILRLARVS